MSNTLELLGSTTPRLWTPPLVAGPPGPCGCGCPLSPQTTRGFQLDTFARDIIGFPLLPWQRWEFIHGLELLPSGKYRFRTVLVLVSRQCGKTSGAEIKNLWKMYVHRQSVITTAQDLDAAEESWANAVAMAESVPELSAEIANVVKTNGKKALILRNGARWKVRAPNRKAGRSYSADDIDLDELREHLDWKTWAAITKTRRARPDSQLWAYTNAGDDRSVVLNELQANARATVPDPLGNPSLGLMEWSGPDDLRCTCGRVKPSPHLRSCRLADPRIWAQAAPALGYLIDAEGMWADLNTDPDEEFLTECLCVRVVDLTPTIIDLTVWGQWQDEDSLARGKVAFSLDMHPDLLYGAIGFTGRRSDGLLHWQVLAHGEGTDWLLAEAVRLNAVHPNVGWFLDGASPAKAKKTDLEKAGLTVHVLDGSETSQACTNVMEAAEHGPGRFVPLMEQRKGKLVEALTEAWRAAAVIPSGDSKRFGRKKSSGDITPLMVITLSDHGFRVHGETQPQQFFAAWR